MSFFPSKKSTETLSKGEKRCRENQDWWIYCCAFFLGGIGVHKFYEGKIGIGILYILTMGLFGVGVIIDLIMIACGNAKDAQGLPITDWGVK